MWDISAPNQFPTCNPSRSYQAQINTALQTKTPLAERGAFGPGAVAAEVAAGDGSAALPTSSQSAGLAQQADPLILKVTSKGAAARGSQLAETAFQACFNQALDLVTQAAAMLGEPIAGLINSGTQWGPPRRHFRSQQQFDLDFGLKQYRTH